MCARVCFANITSRTSIKSMLIKGSETCDAHILRITGERMGSIEADNSPPTGIIDENSETVNRQDIKIPYILIKIIIQLSRLSPKTSQAFSPCNKTYQP